ncbi:putative mycofactocin binding protein MftB [Microbacterium sp. AK009]|uniref:mycofactocin biosynthesis chaperone MftB n=1 Tax=Microbacterium sp. AK009 TaxID=2723068 RepID=UPI0015CCAABA|nr:mycofactocin biosynthesis chaperone MftB [Microbacterium sp. AK009]NYF15483.1 putative mycofactocin binding protein MftB [Microbacterium sp. AK009]
MDAHAPWRLSPQVSVRPEPFGALLYHFGTRKLSFLKDRTLLAVVERLESSDTLEAACDAAGVAVADRPRYVQALQTLASSAMIERRSS